MTKSARSKAKPPRRGQGQCEAKRSLSEGDKDSAKQSEAFPKGAKSQALVLLFAVCCLLFAVNSFASEPTDAAWVSFLKGDYERAIEQAQGLKGYKPHYIMGLCYIKLGKPAQAREHFKFILDTYPDLEVKEETIISLGDTYFLEGDFENAETQYSDFLKNYPSSGMISLAYLKLGQSQRRLGKWEMARQVLTKVITDFPSGFEKPEAEKELQKEFFYYVQAGSFTRKQNANRAKEALIKKGFDAYINIIAQDSRTYYRVCVGKFYKKEEANIALEKIEKNGYQAKIYP